MEFAIYNNIRTRSKALALYKSVTDKSQIIRVINVNTYIDAIKNAFEIWNEVQELGKIPVVIVNALEEPVFTSIYNNLHEFQRIVSGTIDIVNCADLSSFDIICNDNGKVDLEPLNRALTSDYNVYDVVAGTFIVTKSNSEGETIGLSIDDIDNVHRHFFYPEIFSFRNEGDDVTVIKISIELAIIMKQNFISNLSVID